MWLGKPHITFVASSSSTNTEHNLDHSPSLASCECRDIPQNPHSYLKPGCSLRAAEWEPVTTQWGRQRLAWGRTLTVLPLQYHHYSTTITVPPLQYHHYSTTITVPPLQYHHYSITNTVPPLQYHHYSITITVPPLQYHQQKFHSHSATIILLSYLGVVYLSYMLYFKMSCVHCS